MNCGILRRIRLAREFGFDHSIESISTGVVWDLSDNVSISNYKNHKFSSRENALVGRPAIFIVSQVDVINENKNVEKMYFMAPPRANAAIAVTFRVSRNKTIMNCDEVFPFHKHSK